MRAGPYDFEIVLLHRGLATLPLDRIGDLDPDFVDELAAYLQARADLEQKKT